MTASSMGTAPRRQPHRLLRGVTGLVAGLVVLTTCVALVLNSAVVGVGLAAKAASDSFLALPAELRPAPLPQRSVIVDAKGGPIAWLWKENRRVVPLSSIAPVMRTALVDIEDSRFYENSGVDLRAVGRAVARDRAGADSGRQGASTLTQQYVKNLRLAQARTEAERTLAKDDTYERKVQEARFALRLARTTSKDDILAGYLNLVFFGNGAYGVQAAAERYFNVSAARLTLPQAALLAGLVKNPTALDPTRNPEDARARRNVVLDRMLELDHITASQHQKAWVAPLGLRSGGPVAGCRGARGYFCDYVLGALLAEPRLGRDAAARREALETGGFTIVTTLDPKVQTAADAATRRARGSRAALAAAVVQPGTGKVLALSASVPFGVGKGASSVNLPLGGSSGFQAGSTFKLFVLAQALTTGTPLSFPINSPQVFIASDKGKPYPVGNASDSEAGLFTLEQATWLSVNTYFIQLQQRTGIAKPAALAEAMGVRRAGSRPLLRVPSFTLGTNEVTPLAMAGAYATVAARGTYCPSYGLVELRQPVHVQGGRPAAAVKAGALPRSACRRVLAQQVTDALNKVLGGVITQGTGRQAAIGRPAAGKTGTVQDYSSAWFTGYTPELATAVWLGDPRGGYRYPLRNVRIDGTTYPQVYGGGVPAATWSALMRAALAGSKPRALPVPRLPAPTADSTPLPATKPTDG